MPGNQNTKMASVFLSSDWNLPISKGKLRRINNQTLCYLTLLALAGFMCIYQPKTEVSQERSVEVVNRILKPDEEKALQSQYFSYLIKEKILFNQKQIPNEEGIPLIKAVWRLIYHEQLISEGQVEYYTKDIISLPSKEENNTIQHYLGFTIMFFYPEPVSIQTDPSERLLTMYEDGIYHLYLELQYLQEENLVRKYLAEMPLHSQKPEISFHGRIQSIHEEDSAKDADFSSVIHKYSRIQESTQNKLFLLQERSLKEEVTQNQVVIEYDFSLSGNALWIRPGDWNAFPIDRLHISDHYPIESIDWKLKLKDSDGVLAAQRIQEIHKAEAGIDVPDLPAMNIFGQYVMELIITQSHLLYVGYLNQDNTKQTERDVPNVWTHLKEKYNYTIDLTITPNLIITLADMESQKPLIQNSIEFYAGEKDTPLITLVSDDYGRIALNLKDEPFMQRLMKKDMTLVIPGYDVLEKTMEFHPSLEDEIWYFIKSPPPGITYFYLVP